MFDFDDLFILAGCVLILVGTYKICPVATWFVAGVMLIAIGVLVAKPVISKSKPEAKSPDELHVHWKERR